MRPLFFWNTWDEPFKTLYQGLLFVFCASILVYIITYFIGSSFVINWEYETTIKPVKMLFDTYRVGIFEFPIHVNNYVITKGFVASELQVNELPAYILLLWLAVFISIILALITDLNRFGFIASVIIILVIFVGLKFDHLVLFNSYQKTGLFLAIMLYLPSLYIFHFVKPDVKFAIRLATHVAATIILGAVIYKFSGVSYPFLHLMNYGIYVPFILTIVFTFMIGHEIIGGVLRIITSGALVGEKNGLVHFLVISIVFLINVLLVLLKNSKIIELDIYLIGSFWLLTIASIIGIWGFRGKEISYEGIFPFQPIGGILFIGMAITAHLTISYFFITGNDSFVEAIEDIIIYSQLGYGLLFIIYILANFYDMLRQNIDIGKVLYKPRWMPYFISRFAGAVVILALFFRFNMISYNQSVAGFYIGIGDLYLKVENYLSAAEYYKLSNIFSGTSHRANYAMATLEKRNNNTNLELIYLKQAVGKNPTEFAFANLAEKYLKQKRYFEAIFALRDGLQYFPDNGNLMNNLGLAYLEIENIDSAFYYLKRSINDHKSSNESATNIYGMLSLKNLSIKSDTLDYLLKESDYLAATNNLVVLANELKKKSKDKAKVQFGNPANEKIEQVVYNYNKVMNDPDLVDTILLKQTRNFYDSSNTSWFQDNINMANSLALYQQGEVAKSFQILNKLANQNPKKEYFSLLGKLSLSMHANALAEDYFKNAFQNGHLEIAADLAFAYMENGELEKADFIWRQIKSRPDSSNIELANKMIDVINAKDISDILRKDTETKFSFLAYRYKEFNLKDLEDLVLKFESEDIQALGFLRIFYSYLELDQTQKAFDLLQKAGELNISKRDVLDEINLAQCKYAYKVSDPGIMQRLYTNLISENNEVNGYLNLFKKIAESKTITSKNSNRGFLQLGYKNPFFEPGVLESVQFFNMEINDSDIAYDILLKAVKNNPFSIKLNKAYALQCLKVGLNSYAMDTRAELKSMMSSVMFKTFEEEFRNTMAEIESNSSTWQIN